MKKDKLLRQIEIAGILAFIPMILASGPLIGYVIGGLLIKFFNLPNYIKILLAVIGFIASAKETYKFIKISMNIENK